MEAIKKSGSLDMSKGLTATKSTGGDKKTTNRKKATKVDDVKVKMI